MENITIDKLLKLVKSYNEEEIERVYKAYRLAEELHKGQKRQSGEDYITHPLAVTYTLAKMHADGDTLCAGLLHDTVEDTDLTKEEIARLFNNDVAELVDGVTKISKLNFGSKKEANLHNTRKIIASVVKDVRIIIIKLADRLHNMSTLDFKCEAKQKENAKETLDIFVPLAYYIGAYNIKIKLEDYCLKYLDRKSYEKIKQRREKIAEEYQKEVAEMVAKIEDSLKASNIDCEIKVRIKNIYGIYKRLKQGHHECDIHDLVSIKIMVNDIQSCYPTLGCIHKLYHSYDPYFKDYLFNPKENNYRSIHTTVFNNNRLIQVQIRTKDMEKINTNGITEYWNLEKGNARITMQEDIRNKFLFSKAVEEINRVSDDQEFMNHVTGEVFGDKIVVYTKNGRILYLPKDSTPVDFACALDEELGISMVSAVVNDRTVPLNYKLQNHDRVIIIAGYESEFANPELSKVARTNHAKRVLQESRQNSNYSHPM